MPADTPNDRKPGEISSSDREVLKQRASEIGSKLEGVKKRHEGPSAAGRGAAMGRGMRIATELVAGVLVGSVLGWYLDQWLGTKPWLFILFFLLGTAAGMMNIIRQASQEKTPPNLPSVKDDPED
jgi:ATP synthase protein I